MADKEIKFLKEWTIRYVKNKDVISKKITSLNEKDNEFIVQKGEIEHKYLIIPVINDTDSIINTAAEYEHGKTLICFHTKSNFEFLIKNWGIFVDLGRNFIVYFINPFSKTERVLSICPYTHHLISDKDSLVLGLKTMAENVEFTTEDEIKKIVNS